MAIVRKAEYKEQELAFYRNNPFIEALPNLFSDKEILDELKKNNPEYDPEERGMGPKLRFHSAARISQDFYQPMSQIFDIESRISVILRQGYRSRNPLEAGRTALSNELYEAMVENRTARPIPGYTPKATGFTIIGVSGVGKSSAVERILHLYPQVIEHTEYHGQPLPMTQLVWLKLDCPYDGSLGGLCYSFFQMVDQLLGQHYYDSFKKSRASIDSMLTAMVRIAHEYSLGMLVIDEIQHSALAGKRSDALLNFFVTLVNVIGVPVILIGTPKALPILQGEFRQARRGSGHGDLVWNRMEPEDVEWQLFIDSMWEYQWTSNEVELTQEIREAIYDESQGIVVLAVVLYMLVQEDAILSERETFDVADIHRVAQQRMALVQPMLKALRSKDKKKIEEYADITSIKPEKFIDEKWTKRANEILDRREASTGVQTRLRKDLLPALWNIGITPERAEKVIEQVVRESNTKDMGELTKRIWAAVMQGDTDLQQGAQQEGLDEEDLRTKSGYEDIAKGGGLDGDMW